MFGGDTMTKKQKEALWNAVKEPLRLLVLAVLPFAIAYFSNLGYEWAVLVVLVLRGLDKLLHEYGKASKNDILVKGLTRF